MIKAEVAKTAKALKERDDTFNALQELAAKNDAFVKQEDRVKELNAALKDQTDALKTLNEENMRLRIGVSSASGPQTQCTFLFLFFR